MKKINMLVLNKKEMQKIKGGLTCGCECACTCLEPCSSCMTKGLSVTLQNSPPLANLHETNYGGVRVNFIA